jgi:capsular polysaccharide biosynthesis protein
MTPLECSLADNPRTTRFENLVQGRGASAAPLTFVELEASEHRPHQGYLAEFNYASPGLEHLKPSHNNGHKAEALSFTSYIRATLHKRTAIVTTRDGAVITETMNGASFLHSRAEILQKAEEKPERLQTIYEPCVFFSHGAFAVYGHFFFETLVCMYSLLPLLRDGRLKLIMPLTQAGWPDALLDQLNVPRSARITITESHTTFRNLIVCSSCSGGATFRPGPALPRFAENLRSQVAPAPKPLRLYLTRLNQAITTQRRELQNETELFAALEPLGFVGCEPSQLPFARQIELFARAEFILGVHGSAFANVAFAKPGCMVAEILPAYWAETKGGAWIPNITNICKQNYFYMLANSTKIPHGNTVEIDQSAVIERVKAALAVLPKPQS